MNMITCTCIVCGVKYEKPLDFKTWNDKHPNVFFKWSMQYCDTHRKERELKALENLPAVLEALANGPATPETTPTPSDEQS